MLVVGEVDCVSSLVRLIACSALTRLIACSALTRLIACSALTRLIACSAAVLQRTRRAVKDCTRVQSSFQAALSRRGGV